MEIHQLRYFCKVADLGSFTRAASACFVAQPSLSQQIIKLEAELGSPLFERLARRVILTDAGQRLRPIAAQILRLVDEARSEVVGDSEAGRLAVASPPTVVPYFLTGVLKTFADAHPRVQVEVSEDVTSAIIQRIHDCEVDLAVLPLPIEGTDFEVEPLFEEELFLLLPAGHRLAQRSRITIDQIQDEPFILLNDAHCLTGNALGFCRQKRFQPISTSRVNQLATIQELVSLGQGISLIPAMARHLDTDPRRVYRSLAGDRPMRTIGLVRLASRRPSDLAERFAATLRECVATLGKPS